MEAQLEEQRARLELLKAQTKRVVADGRIMAYEELAEAEQKLESAKGKLKELAHTGESAWEEMKTGVEKAWNDLTEASKKASAKFKAKE